MNFIFSFFTLLVNASIRLELDNAYHSDHTGMSILIRTIKSSTVLSNVPVNLGYTANVYIGSSRQLFKVVIDTGSADLWVPSVDCELESCKRHIRYNPSLSNTASSTGRIFTMKYGTGEVGGNIFRDQIEFAGFTLQHQPIGAVVSQSAYFSNKPFDGIFGLAFGNISSTSKKSLLDRLKENGMIENKRFSLFLTRFGDKASELLFDDVNQDYFEGNWTSTDLVSDVGFWVIRIDGIQVNFNGKTALIYFAQDQAIMDTGSTLIYAPKKAARALHDRIPGAKKKWFKNYYTFPCKIMANITVNFMIGGMKVTIFPENLSLGSEDGGKTCISAISGTEGNEWILGSAFLRNIYSLWDAEARKISFAKLKK